MRLVYGHQITSDDDPYLAIANRVGYALSNSGSPASTPVDFFPIREYARYRIVELVFDNTAITVKYFPSWFPGAYYAGFARDNRSAIEDLNEYPFKEVKRLMARELLLCNENQLLNFRLQAEGKANPSFLAHNLEVLHRDGPNCPNTIEDIKGTAGVMYCAASDTVNFKKSLINDISIILRHQTWSSISIFFLAMVLYPECQVRAQKEIDAVIGSERLPTFDDRRSLPYVECVLQETLRCVTVFQFSPTCCEGHSSCNTTDGIMPSQWVRQFLCFILQVSLERNRCTASFTRG
jgi:Cytochrome P450